MSVLLSSVSSVLVILFIILIGFILSKKGWFDERSTKLIARLVTQVALPADMIITITKNFSSHQLLTTLPDLRFPVISMLILFGLSVAVAQVIHIKRYHRGLFESMFFNSNTIFIGLPINMALFGTPSIPYVLVYYMANTTFFWTIGIYLIQRDGDHDAKMNFIQAVKKVFSPPLLGFMLAVVLVLTHFDQLIPSFLNQSLTYIGNLTVPLSMLFIGIAISHTNLKDINLSRKTIWVILGRFVFAPGLMALLVLPTGLPTLMKQVFIMQAAMPVMTNAPVVSKLYNADDRYASITVAETTVLSLIVIPILMTLVKQI